MDAGRLDGRGIWCGSTAGCAEALCARKLPDSDTKSRVCMRASLCGHALWHACCHATTICFEGGRVCMQGRKLGSHHACFMSTSSPLVFDWWC